MVYSDELFLQKNKQNILLETGSLQLGHDALGDLQDGGMVGLPFCVRAVFGDAVSHRVQIRFREVGLHQTPGMLHDILGSSPDEGLQSAAGGLQPLGQTLGSCHALRLERPKQCLQRPAQAIQCRPALCRLFLRFCKKHPAGSAQAKENDRKHIVV